MILDELRKESFYFPVRPCYDIYMVDENSVVLTRTKGRATQDLDLDFIRFSISEESIGIFIEKLNCIDGIRLRMSAPIEELKHRDYKGKRIHIKFCKCGAVAVDGGLDYLRRCGDLKGFTELSECEE